MHVAYTVHNPIQHSINHTVSYIETAKGRFELGPHDAPAGLCKNQADRLASRLAISQHLYRIYGQMLDGLLVGNDVDIAELRILKQIESKLSCGYFDDLPFAPSLDLVKRFYAFNS